MTKAQSLLILSLWRNNYFIYQRKALFTLNHTIAIQVIATNIYTQLYKSRKSPENIALEATFSSRPIAT